MARMMRMMIPTLTITKAISPTVSGVEGSASRRLATSSVSRVNSKPRWSGGPLFFYDEESPLSLPFHHLLSSLPPPLDLP
jgi:hypothetical protein